MLRMEITGVQDSIFDEIHILMEFGWKIKAVMTSSGHHLCSKTGMPCPNCREQAEAIIKGHPGCTVVLIKEDKNAKKDS